MIYPDDGRRHRLRDGNIRTILLRAHKSALRQSTPLSLSVSQVAICASPVPTRLLSESTTPPSLPPAAPPSTTFNFGSESGAGWSTGGGGTVAFSRASNRGYYNQIHRTDCSNSCREASDGWCDDSGPGAEYSSCSMGTDCVDCGSRTSRIHGSGTTFTLTYDGSSCRCIASSHLLLSSSSPSPFPLTPSSSTTHRAVPWGWR